MVKTVILNISAIIAQKTKILIKHIELFLIKNTEKLI